MNFPWVDLRDLHTKLGFDAPIAYEALSLNKDLSSWKMEINDAPILRYIYKNFKPRRHLEFGTWQGIGATYCLEECAATVWTINLPFGESSETDIKTYGYYDEELPALMQWAEKIGMLRQPNLAPKGALNLPKWLQRRSLEQRPEFRTDSLGFIGRKYLEKNLGGRVCQIYCDSRQWDTSNFPSDFFDSVLVDGGHSYDLIQNDTEKALSVLRPGGIVLWHDFCPDNETLSKCSSTRDVVGYFESNWKAISGKMKDLFWLKPSWILLGIKKG